MIYRMSNKLPITFFLYSTAVLLALPRVSFAESLDTKIQDGMTQYKEGNFKEAGQNFSSAHRERPEDYRLAYNQGNANYKEGNFEEALKAFNLSALDEKNPDIRKKSVYNSGNALVKLNKLEEAESVYKKVLAMDPSDMDAKFNLEYVREQMKKKEEQKSDSEKDKKQDSSAKNEQSNEKKKDNEQNDKENQQDESQSLPAPPKNSDDPQTIPNTPKEQGESEKELEFSKEMAEQMLNRLSEDLKKISRIQAGKSKSEYQGNDW